MLFFFEIVLHRPKVLISFFFVPFELENENNNILNENFNHTYFSDFFSVWKKIRDLNKQF